MGIKIAGREVKVGDRLYHRKFDAFGTVTRIQTRNIELEVDSSLGVRNKIYVENGGIINRRKEIYWHRPLALDYPEQDISKIQDVVNVVLKAITDGK